MNIVSRFQLLDQNYNKSKDFEYFYSLESSNKYLMIRSLKKENLNHLLSENHSDMLKAKSDEKKQCFFENIDCQKLADYMCESKEFMVEEDIQTLQDELMKNCTEECHVHNDDFNGNLNRIIRNTSVLTIKKLDDNLTNLKSQLDGYAKWQWYNQKCSDLNENIIKKQKNIIPTLRPIAKIGFFVKIGDFTFPFDLKTTIFPKGFSKKRSDEYIDEFLSDKSKHYELLKWLYSEQNPRLFSNNYRYFVILVDKNDLDKSRYLKCNTKLICTKQNVCTLLCQKTNNTKLNILYFLPSIPYHHCSSVKHTP